MKRPMIKNEMNTADAALAYAHARLRVFPVHSIRNGACTCGGSKNCKPGKHPIGSLVPRGVLDASVDAALIKGWWTQVPDANIGIATGSGSGLVVLDVDGCLGEASLVELEDKHNSLPP